MTRIVALMFVAGVGGGVGYGLARRSALVPGEPGQAPRPQPGRLATVAPTHPAARRPQLYDWQQDGAA